MSMYTYRYLCTQRPPAPGAVPSGAVKVDHNEGVFKDAKGRIRRFWGAVEYDHELSAKEACDYELEFESEG
jgi:hypothetical protein